jgi:thioredoxin reductase
MASQKTYDCVIVGGGPAGLTCAIFLGRYRRNVLVIDGGKPRNYAAKGIHGFLGHHVISPGELLKRGRAEAALYGVEIVDGTVSRVEKVGDIFEVETPGGVVQSRRVVLAYGVRDLLPDVPGIEKFYGTSVHHCPDCDGYEVSDKRVGVIGSGTAVVGMTLTMLRWTHQLTVLTNGHEGDWRKEDQSKLLAQDIGVRHDKIVELVGTDGRISALVLSSGERIEVDALFFTIGVERSCSLAEDLGCKLVKDTTCLAVDDYKQTSVEGIYAVGDLVPGAQLAITSAADGAIAAIAINKSLQPPSRTVSG